MGASKDGRFVPLTEADINRFTTLIGDEDNNHCVPWEGPVSSTGMPRFAIQEKPSASSARSAIRIMHELLTGEPLRDHEKYVPCQFLRICINPEHTVVPKDPPRPWRRRPRCTQGHIRTKKNTKITAAGKHFCLICEEERRAGWVDGAMETLKEVSWPTRSTSDDSS